MKLLPNEQSDREAGSRRKGGWRERTAVRMPQQCLHVAFTTGRIQSKLRTQTHNDHIIVCLCNAVLFILKKEDNSGLGAGAQFQRVSNHFGM